MEDEMINLRKRPLARLRYTVRLGEEADRKLHKLAPMGDVTYNRLWKDVRPPCRKRTLVRRNFATIRGLPEHYVEDAGTGVSLPGDEEVTCFDNAAAPDAADEQPRSVGATSGAEDSDADEVMDGAYTSHLKDGVPWTTLPAPPPRSPLDPWVRHARLDAMTARERGRIASDSANEHHLLRELAKVRWPALQSAERAQAPVRPLFGGRGGRGGADGRARGRQVKQLKQMVAARERQVAKRAASGELWAGVDTDLTAEDLREKSKAEQAAEDAEWGREDAMNRLMAAQTPLADKLKEARATRAADERALDAERGGPAEARDWRGEGAETSVGASSAEQQRAEQREIHSNDEASAWLWWERDPTLHYRDLAPNGKDTTPRKYMFRYTRRPQAPAAPPPPPGAPPPPPPPGAPGAPAQPGWCVFCQTASKYLTHTEKEEVAESSEADPANLFTPQDWKDGQGDADFEKTFPDTNDLRVIDWLAAGDETEPPYDARKDSMSAVGAEKKDWPPDFVPKAKGYYTNWGADGYRPGTGWAALYGGKYLPPYKPPDDGTRVVYQSPRPKKLLGV